MFAKEDYNKKSPLAYFDEKIISNPKILTLLINKRGKNAGYASSDAIIKYVGHALSKTGNRKLIEFALKKSAYYFTGLSEKYRSDKKIALITLKRGNIYMFDSISGRARKDKEVLEAAEKQYSKGFFNIKTKKKDYRDINDVEDNDLLPRDLYWYIYYKKNPHKLQTKLRT